MKIIDFNIVNKVTYYFQSPKIRVLSICCFNRYYANRMWTFYTALQVKRLTIQRLLLGKL